MATIYYDQDADLKYLEGKTVAILGYGSQGHAHAQNLRDSGVRVIVGLHEGSRSRERAQNDGFEVVTPREAAARADIISMLMPDHVQKGVYEESVAPELKPANSSCSRMASISTMDESFPRLTSMSRWWHRRVPVTSCGTCTSRASGYRHSSPFTRMRAGKPSRSRWPMPRGSAAPRLASSRRRSRKRRKPDLFGEQAVLCGGVSHLIQAGFETLVEAGYQPEIAYFEVLNELKLIVDLIYEGGLKFMRYSVSDTAEYGDYVSGPKIIDDHVRETMHQILQDIQTGRFAQQWIQENEAGRPNFYRLREEHLKHPIEEVGERLRAMMPWLKPRQIPS